MVKENGIRELGETGICLKLETGTVYNPIDKRITNCLKA